MEHMVITSKQKLCVASKFLASYIDSVKLVAQLNEVQQKIPEADRTILYGKIEEITNWLEKDSTSATEKDFEERHIALKDLCDPLLSKWCTSYIKHNGDYRFMPIFNIAKAGISSSLNDRECGTSPETSVDLIKGTTTTISTLKTNAIGTHDGTFHCDEALACFMLQLFPQYKNGTILRSRDINLLKEKCDIIVDVGGVFEHKSKLYDHHQKEFKETLSTIRPELGDQFNIRLSSAGLIYAFYGEEVIQHILKNRGLTELNADELKLCYKQIYKKFICEIDAIDNGVPMCGENTPLYTINSHLSARIGRLNPSWDSDPADKDSEVAFARAKDVVGNEFSLYVANTCRQFAKAREIVRKALENCRSIHSSGEIIVLEEFCPWKTHLAELEKEYNMVGVPKLVLFADGKVWRVAGVPITPESFLGRKFFPASWRGLRDQELSTVAGVDDLIFVHHTGFIGGATNKTAAVKMALKSLGLN